MTLEKTPPLNQLQLDLLDLLAKAQTLGARRALALACRDGKLHDGRAKGQHWAAVKDAKNAYEIAKSNLLNRLASSSTPQHGTPDNQASGQEAPPQRGRRSASNQA